jgi:predicted transcriptional regulator
MAAAAASLTYLARIMEVLIEYHRITITNVAMLSRINHQRCRAIITFLVASGYVDSQFDGSKEYFSLTNPGLKLAILLHLLW